METCKKWKKLAIDLSPLGLQTGESRSDYLDTPKGAKIIGWAGVDGVHYCFIKDQGDTVFAVHPLGEPNVVPIAENFHMLLCLLVTCGHMALLDQVHHFPTPEKYAAFRDENPMTPEQNAVIQVLLSHFDLSTVDDPYGYIRTLQDNFAYDTLQFKKAWYENRRPEKDIPEDQSTDLVWWESGLYGFRGKGKPAVKLSLHQSFSWENQSWLIPAAYVCSKGLILDLCMTPDIHTVRQFLDCAMEAGEEDAERLDAMNPLCPDFTVEVTMGKHILTEKRGSGAVYLPPDVSCQGETDITGTKVVERYQLDSTRPWVIRRLCFPWVTAKTPKITSFTGKFLYRPTRLFAEAFVTPEPGKSVIFAHPHTEQEYQLTCLNLLEETVDMPVQNGMEMPTKLWKMEYTVEPPCENMTIVAVGKGDKPRKLPGTESVAFTGTAVVGIIGGADGPTSVFVSSHKEKTAQCKTAFSQLYFVLPENPRWQPVFREKLVQDKEIIIHL